MSTTGATPAPGPATTPAAPAVHPVVRVMMIVLSVLLAGGIAFEVYNHGGWTWLAWPLGLIGPDLAFLVGIGAPNEPGRLARRVVPVYNLVHRPWLPLILVVVLTVSPWTTDQVAPWFVLGLAWLLHLTVDRAVGYRLRAKDGSIRPPRRLRPTS